MDIRNGHPGLTLLDSRSEEPLAVVGYPQHVAAFADKTFPTITPHDLRHTAASLAVSAGANVKAVQRMLGHAKASMTLDVYADLFDDDLDSVAVRLDAAIKSAADTLRTKSTQ